MKTRTTPLAHIFEVYIPVTRVMPEFKQRIVDAHGGLTILPAGGLWKDADGVTVEESVYIYRWACDYDYDDWATAKTNLNQIVHDLLAAGEQAVFFTIDGHAYIREQS